MNSFKRIIKKILQGFGILVRKYNSATSEELRRAKLLQHYGIDLVFDIGANKEGTPSGSWMRDIRAASFPLSRLVPLTASSGNKA